MDTLLFLAAAVQKEATHTTMLKALWIGFKWPFLCFLGFMLLRVFAQPTWQAIRRLADR
jgi:hypothetical protein